MTIKNPLKRVIAGALAVLVMACSIPANADLGGIFGGTDIVASAEKSDLSTTIATNQSLTTYYGTNVTITAKDKGDPSGMLVGDTSSATISVSDEYIITKVELTKGSGFINDLRSSKGKVTYSGDVATVSDVNAQRLTVGGEHDVNIKQVKVYYTEKTEWAVGENINLNGKWFFIYNLDTVRARGKNSSAAVPTPSYLDAASQWKFGNFISIDQYSEQGSGYIEAGGVSSLYITKPSDKSSADKPSGIKIKSGSGTQADPYTFELVYPPKVDVTSVSYLKWDDTEKKLVNQTGDAACTEYTVVTAETTAFEDGKWYVVNADTTISNRITVTGTAHLILADGKTLTASKGIEVSAGNTLNIYGQSEGDTAGKLFANANDYNAGIGGGAYGAGGTVTVNGGNITANGGVAGAGIGGGRNGAGGTFTVNGGTVTATGGGYAAGIGGGFFGAGGTVTINGGTVTANGGLQGAGIGSGNGYTAPVMPSAGTVTIYNGTVTATGGLYGAGIGGGSDAQGGTVIIYDGTVNAYGSKGGSGIGGGSDANGGDVTIHGGTVTAYGGDGYGSGAMGIGKGANFQNNGTLTVADTHGVFGGESEDPTDIQTDYASTRWMYMIVKGVPHSHDFSYSADGATITATCNGKGMGGCDITEGLTMTISAPTSLTYDGTAKEATLNNDYNNTAFPGTYTIEYFKGETKLDGAPVDAGKYTASITVEEQTASVNYEIAKADPTVKTAPAAIEGLTYNGEPQDLITAGTSDDGTVQYAVVETDDDTPEYTLVKRDSPDSLALDDVKVNTVCTPDLEGEYKGLKGIKFSSGNYIIDGITYTDIRLCYSTDLSKYYLMSNKGPLALHEGIDGLLITDIDSDSGKVYIELVNTENPAGDVQIDEQAWVEVIPKETDAGEYNVYYRVKGDDNHNNTKPVKIEGTKIGKAAPTLTDPKAVEGLVEDGTAKKLVTEGSTEDGQLQYALGTDAKTEPESSTFGAGVPEMTKAGTYYVWYRVIGDTNHTDSQAKCITVTISEKKSDDSSKSDSSKTDSNSGGSNDGANDSSTTPDTGFNGSVTGAAATLMGAAALAAVSVIAAKKKKEDK